MFPLLLSMSLQGLHPSTTEYSVKIFSDILRTIKRQKSRCQRGYTALSYSNQLSVEPLGDEPAEASGMNLAWLYLSSLEAQRIVTESVFDHQVSLMGRVYELVHLQDALQPPTSAQNLVASFTAIIVWATFPGQQQIHGNKWRN